MKAFLVFIFASTILVGAKTFLVVVANSADQASQSAPQSATADIHSQFINLNEILQHQQALVEECHKLEHFRMGQLKQLVQFNQDNDQVHLGNPILLQMPVVCLLLNGPPRSDLSAKPKLPLRLDIANWLYDTDDLIDELARANTNKSRQIKRRQTTTTTSQDNDDLLASHYFDVNRARASSNDRSLDANSLEEKQIQEHLEELVQDERFQHAIRQDQAKIEPLLSPVVLVPGLAGSRLQARVMKKYKVNIICKKQHDWQEMWLSLTSFLPVAIDCWIDNARLEYDPTTGFVRDPPGVESRVPEFGSIESVRHLDLKSPKLTKYFDAIIERYLKLGYQADRNLFAAPYDFRLAPQQLETTFFVQLRDLIDKAASSGGGKKRPVTLVCHSMGCTHLLVFLRQQSSAWRQAKVRKVIALSSPWGGSIKALKALVVGDQFNMPIVSELKMRELARTFPSVAYLLPQAEIFGEPNANHVHFNAQVLVQTPKRSYKVNQMGELLQDLGLEQQWQWYQRAASLIQPQSPLPDVHLDCIHSINMPTTETIIFRNQTDFPDGSYELAEGDGDGTVNHQSLLICAKWAQMLPDRVKHKVIPNTSHTGLLSHQAILEYITEDVAIDRPQERLSAT